MGHSKTPSISEQVVERVPEPPEVRNWKVNIYCIGVCFGALALGELIILVSAFHVSLVERRLTILKATMSLSWAGH